MVTVLLEEAKNVECALDYNIKKVNAGVATVVAVNNIADDSLRGIKKRLLALERKNIRTERTAFHMAVNPIAADNMDRKKVIAYIKDVMAGFGYADQSYAVFVHNDIAREHFHVVSVRVNDQGRSIVPMAKDKSGKIVPYKLTHRLCERLQKDLQKKYGYSLEPANRDEIMLSMMDPFNHSKGGIKLQLNHILDQVTECFYFTTQSQLIDALNHFRVRAKFVPSKYQEGKFAIVLNGTDAEGKVITRSVYRGDEAAVRANNSKLRNQNPQLFEANKSSVLQIFTSRLHSAESEGNLTRALKACGIDMKINRTNDGKAFGVTFYDWEKFMAFKSSELSRSINKFIQQGDYSTEAKLRIEQALLFDIDKFDEKCAMRCRFKIVTSDVQSYANAGSMPAGDIFEKYLGQISECALRADSSPNEAEYKAVLEQFFDDSQAFMMLFAKHITDTLEGHDGSNSEKRKARRKAYNDIIFIRKFYKGMYSFPAWTNIMMGKRLSPIMKSIEEVLDESMACEDVTIKSLKFNGHICLQYYDYPKDHKMDTFVSNAERNLWRLKSDFFIEHAITVPEVSSTPDDAVQIFTYETEDGCRYLMRSNIRSYDDTDRDRLYIANPCNGGTLESLEWIDRFGNPHTLDEVVKVNIEKNDLSPKKMIAPVQREEKKIEQRQHKGSWLGKW